MMIPNPSSYALTTHQLTLAYDGKTIIEDLDIAIPKNQITVLIGPNGCGKSTLLKGLGRILQPKSGIVYLENQSLRQLKPRAIAKQLSLLPQSQTAPEGLTVRDLVAQGRYPHQGFLHQWSKEDERQVEQALHLTQMHSFANNALDCLSGGQRQRAWIAMTLAQNTAILLLDEPTTYLDLAHQIEVLDLLFELNREQSRTIVLVLHDLNQACRYADHLVVMKSGKIHAQGAPQDIMTESMIQEVFGLNSVIITDPITGTPLCIPKGRHAKLSTSFLTW